jgi:tetratricopeptide (TPR) repeat protein
LRFIQTRWCMTKLKDLYTDFFRVDLDAPGGYARVADVVAHQQDGTLVHRAFKLMRHDLLDLLDEKKVGLQRFENEFKILLEITRDKTVPSAITWVYDSGFVETELSKGLRNLRHKDERLSPTPDLEIISTGTDIQKFLETKSILMEQESNHWLPYLVVDLAPYDDSLARQIKVQNAGKTPNLYALPVNTIVEMALQLLDVMEYLHKKLGVAYIDWKPEHIYWNEASKQLKLIDWNVITQLEGGLVEKQKTIREDIRMFSGAALYCSLALTDPEELTKPIGPVPDVPDDKIPVILPRYWTDKPNFYQRDEILDEKIKQIVQKALDPNQGFNSPQELRNVLLQYLGKNYRQTERDLITGLPYDAVQYFRRARSYIAAKDYVYANNWLQLAVEAARKAGVVYVDAEQLLNNVQDILAANEVKQEVNPLLEEGQWEIALDVYTKAIVQYPANAILKKEFDGLQGLLHAEMRLQNKGFFRLFTNLFRLKTVLDSTKDIIKPNNPLYSFVRQQYNQIRSVQIGSAFVLLVVTLFSSVSIAKLIIPPEPSPTITVTAAALVPSVISTYTVTPTSTLIVTAVPSIAPTDTFEPTPTLLILGYGKLEVYYFKPFDEPNKNILTDVTVQRSQFLTILAEEMNGGALWYKCAWEADGVVYQGWILADRITIIKATPTPTRLPYTMVMTFGELDTTSYKPYYDDLNLLPQDVLLKKNQSLQILGAKEYNRDLWYECTWEINDVPGRGWILAKKVKIVQAPTSTSVP